MKINSEETYRSLIATKIMFNDIKDMLIHQLNNTAPNTTSKEKKDT